MERITNKKLRDAFDILVSNASVAGFDSRNWDLIAPPEASGGEWCLVDRGYDGHAHGEVPLTWQPQIGSTNREAYLVIRAITRTLFAVVQLMADKNGSN